MPVLLLPQGPALPYGVDLQYAINDVLPALGASTITDIADWCVLSELYDWFDDANKRLAHRVGFWVDRDDAIAIADDDITYDDPTGHVDTLHVSLDGSKLRPTTAAELEALDPLWPATTGTPSRFSKDAAPVGETRIYPGAMADGTIAVIYHRFQPTIAAGSSTLPIPSPMQDYFTFFAMAEARGKESDGAIPEMADHFRQRADLYLQLAEHYWGPGR